MNKHTTKNTAALNPLPSGMQTLHDRDAFIIRRNWFSPMAFFLVFFCIFWNGFMIFWMYTTLTKGIWIMAAFGSIHALIGLGMLYFTIASFINKTDISVDPNYLSVRHYPLPWIGSKKIRVHEISQLYCKKHVTHSKNGTRTSYRVYVITQNNREQKLVSGLNSPNQAQYIEQEIEVILGLENQTVTGEL